MRTLRIALIASIVSLTILVANTAEAGYFLVPTTRQDLLKAIGPNAVGNQLQGVLRTGVTRPQATRTNDRMFSDVPAGHPNEDAIQYVARYGILRGFADGTFRPDATMTRGEFTQAVADQVFSTDFVQNCFENISYPYPPEYALLFADMEKEGEQAKRICAALMANVVQGYPSGEFLPTKPINFAEAAKILVRGYDVSFLPYVDSGNEWFKLYVSSLADRAGIPLSIPGFDSEITRGEAAEMLYRIDADVRGKPSQSYQDLMVQAGWSVASFLLKLVL